MKMKRDFIKKKDETAKMLKVYEINISPAPS